MCEPMKQEDVMRALECCIKTQCENCCNLGSWHEQWNCMTDLMKKALALLREKDARIKELEEAQGAEFTCFVGDPHKVDHCPYCDELVKKDAEIERLKKHQESVSTVCNRANEHYNALYEQAKEILKAEVRAEAITEFAERLKRFYRNLSGKTVGGSVEYHIEQIAKEMKEDLNAT